MMTKNFSKQELECKCGCGLVNYDDEFMTALQHIRNRYKKAMIVTSGSRCNEHNRAVGGSDNSDHTHGRGIDIACNNSVDRFLIINFALATGFDRIGIRKSFIHLGLSNEKTNINNVIW